MAGLNEFAVHFGQAFAQGLEFFRTGQAGLLLWRGRCCRYWGDDRCCGFGRAQGLTITALGVIAQACNPQGAQGLDLVFILDLEVAEGKVVFPPGQFKLDIQADTQLVGGYVG